MLKISINKINALEQCLAYNKWQQILAIAITITMLSFQCACFQTGAMPQVFFFNVFDHISLVILKVYIQ